MADAKDFGEKPLPSPDAVSPSRGPMEKEVGIATGVESDRRKSSIVSAIKSNYGLAQTPPADYYDPDEKPRYDSTHRKLKPRHIQLIGIGGTIGTALFVQIGQGLLNGGPGSLFLAFTIW